MLFQIIHVKNFSYSNDDFKLAMRIVTLARQNKLKDVTHGATHYFNPKKANPSWAKKMKKTATIGHHDFYK